MLKSYESRAWYEGQQKRMAASERARQLSFVWRVFVVTLIIVVAWVLVAGV